MLSSFCISVLLLMLVMLADCYSDYRIRQLGICYDQGHWMRLGRHIWLYNIISFFPPDIIQFLIRYALSRRAWNLVLEQREATTMNPSLRKMECQECFYTTTKDNPPMTFAVAACETQDLNVTVLQVFDKEPDPSHDIMEFSYNVSTTTIDTNSSDGGCWQQHLRIKVPRQRW
uniref:Uncharacterized protein n=1 Tax=Zea mays TaxID=4577 RepID=A0A804LDD3_MAIZE